MLLILFIFFCLGLIIGSFLNVVIYRLNTKKTLGGRSGCMSCGYELRFYELVPVLSFLGLKGRCSNCKGRISLQYPLVEMTSGLIFAFLFLKFQSILPFSLGNFIIVYAYYALIFSLLLVITVYDIRHKIIPDTLVFSVALLSFIGLFFVVAPGIRMPVFHIPGIYSILSGVIVALPFFLLWLISGGRWMGLGDAKLALGVGWLLGIEMAFSALTLAFWSGAIVGLALLAFSKRYGLKSEIPFAPYIVLGAFIVFMFNLHFFNFGL